MGDFHDRRTGCAAAVEIEFTGDGHDSDSAGGARTTEGRMHE